MSRIDGFPAVLTGNEAMEMRVVCANVAGDKCRDRSRAPSQPAHGLMGEDRPSDQLPDLGDDGVAEGPGSLDPEGNPIIVSTSEGCGWVPTKRGGRQFVSVK